MVGQSFKDWVSQQVEERNAEMSEKRDLMISMDPVMAQKFANSTHISRKYFKISSIDFVLVHLSLEGNFCEYAKGIQQTSPNYGRN